MRCYHHEESLRQRQDKAAPGYQVVGQSLIEGVTVLRLSHDCVEALIDAIYTKGDQVN